MLSEYFSTQKKKIRSTFYDSSSNKKNIKADRFIPHTVSKNLFALFNELNDTNKAENPLK